MPKEFLTYQQQIEKLQRSGLEVADIDACERVLREIGYFPVVNGYQSFFRDPSTRVYRAGTAFGDIVALYRFDAQVRGITLSALLSVETKLRSALAYEFCKAHGHEQERYLDASCYGKSRDARRTLPKLLKMLSSIANVNTDHEYLSHYRTKYGNVPLWVAVNAMTFGQLSKMYAALGDSDKSKIARRFGAVSAKELGQLVRVLALFRNVCAHGERLFSHRCHVEIPDMPLHAKLGIARSGPNYTLGKKDLFAVVIALRYLLSNDEFKVFKADLSRCISSYVSSDESIGEERLLAAMGFPPEWKKITRFKL